MDHEIQKKVIETIAMMNAAVKNLRLYPASSAIIMQSIDRLYHAFLEIFQQIDSLVLSESERTLLINGTPPIEKDQHKPHMATFLYMMLDLGLKSVSLGKGVEKSELITFLDILKNTAEEIAGKGGLQRLMEEKNLTHILLNKKVYVVTAENQQVLAGPDIQDDQIQRDTPLVGNPSIASTTELSDMILHLCADSEREISPAPIERLISDLSNTDQDIRSQAASVLSDIIERFPVETRQDVLKKYSENFVEWIRREEIATQSFKRICDFLKNRMEEDIRMGKFHEALPPLTVFHEIAEGVLEKNDSIHAIALEVVTALSNEELLDILVDAFNAEEETVQVEAGKILVRLNTDALNRLLDILRDHEGKNTRIRILQLMLELGPYAVTVIRDRIREEEPWYYLRNLAYLLGRIGNDACVAALQPLCLSKNKKVREEALKSLQRIGGKESARVLISILPTADESLKSSIVETLGTLKAVEAVTLLMRMLRDRPFMVSSARIELEEKICVALGQIGSWEATPVLSGIQQTGFISMKSYPERVKIAAGKDLASIKKKRAKTDQTGR